MSTLGWVILAIAFLIFIMVANNSWQTVWTKIRNTNASKQTSETPTPESPAPSTPPGVTPQPDIVEPGTLPTATA